MKILWIFVIFAVICVQISESLRLKKWGDYKIDVDDVEENRRAKVLRTTKRPCPIGEACDESAYLTPEVCAPKTLMINRKCYKIHYYKGKRVV